MPMRPLLNLAFGLSVALSLAPLQGRAQAANCGSHEQVVALLADRYGESRQGMGLAANNSIVEIFASLDSGTWTITVTQPGGPTCLVASGEGYVALAEALPPAGSNS